MNEAVNMKRPFVYNLYESPVAPEEIERRSFEAIDREADSSRFSPEEWIVVRRMIHTTADFGLLDAVKFSPDAIGAAVEAFGRGAPLYVDSNMIRSGLSVARLAAVWQGYTREMIRCHVADGDVAEECAAAGLPRSIFAARKARPWLDGAVVAIGNAPVALLEINRMVMEEGIRPAVVIGMPVGFIHVLESKEELMRLGVPYITVTGRRGGSPMAVSVVHSLLAIAEARRGAAV